MACGAVSMTPARGVERYGGPPLAPRRNARPSSVSRARHRGRPPRAPWSRRRAGARRIVNEVERS
ncbi:hypothetical protein D8O27_22665 [Burkholderia mallei]|uniref:Uncharacterized protein n=3 Tax=pseudomallei group TaxID=111527 RepID=A0AAX1X6L1_BURML|nr:hypothetical protein BMA0651 [Burkholderia mallei ATCC 23344]AUL54688.1 hypothetical protein BHT10_01190 [Burkholderia pseudomallei]PNW96158.1 hypothetical protein CF649_30430 [Burkholderia sp. 136(2017)]PNX10798.1 hypothetical protein CF650_34060 [Burkholderia sp. 129]PNX26100.1 hypothetical protein CF647_28115 [Burkholderia sp. 117]PNX33637.1 hypothetical protein CF648_30435 [Burkholderia sp. 137]RKN94255.1 hypothetical protein D8O31_22610 [Burkholderia mallei]